MAAVSTMILRSLRLTGEKVRGGSLTTNEQTELLAEWNTFVDACSIERLYCYQVQQDSLALTTSTFSYTIGTNGVFNVNRPNKLVDPCFIRDSSSLDSPLTIIEAEQYGYIVQKSAGYTVPTYIFYDHGYSATSTGTLYLYPSPSAGLTLFINSWKQLGQASTLSQNFHLPPGYQLFLETNFAVHTAAGVTSISPELEKMAREAKAAVKSLNQPDTVMYLDPGVVTGRHSNIFTGT